MGGLIKSLRRLIGLMGNVAYELKATAKDGAGRCPTFKKHSGRLVSAALFF